MTTTPNYGFKIAEGTDTVNLLTQSYPNFTDLDSILKSIELTGITSSVATKVGTVFQIVRTNTDLNVLKFVATANYAAGDTFTVDGVSVTATAVDGSALPAGAFVINQTVMAILNGTVLTVLVGGGNAGPIEAEDVDYDNSVSGLTATDVQAAIDEVKSDADSAIGTINSTLTTNFDSYDLSTTSFAPGTPYATMFQAIINKLFPNALIQVDVEIKNYGNASAYVGYLTVTDLATSTSQTQEAYRQTSTITMNGFTVSLTMPSAASGGTLTITKSGTHNITVLSNPINATVPASFLNTGSVSGWDSSGVLQIAI